MKKLLKIVNSIILFASFSLNIIGCNYKDNIEQRFKTPLISNKIKNWIIAEVSGKQNYINYSFNELFNKTDLKTLAIRLLDINISKYYYTVEENTRAKFTGIQIDKEKLNSNNLISNQIITFIKQVALDKLYTDYLNGIANNSNMEFKMANQGYLPSYQTDNWYVQGLTSDFLVNSDNSDFDNTFRYTKKQLKNEIHRKNFVNKTINSNPSEFKGFNNLQNEDQKKQALEIRFNDYYIHSAIPNIIDTILTSTYLHQNQFKLHNGGPNLEDKSIYINKYNALFNNIQSWDDNNNWKTYIKMVWEVKMEKTQLEKLIGLDSGKIININNNLAKGNNKDDLFNTLKSIFNNSDNDKKNKIPDGIDPFFGLNGFKGIIGFNKSNNDIFTKYNGEISYIENLRNQTQAGIMVANHNVNLNEISRYEYTTPNKKEASLVFVLPIYTIDLLKNMNINYSNNQKNNKELQMKYYGNSGAEINLDLPWVNTGSSVKWIYNEISYLGTHDKNGNKIYDSNGKPFVKYNNNLWKTNLLKWIEYTMGQNSALQTSGKTRLYSLAFAYNPDNIYSQTLYDEISSYVQKKDS